MYHLTFINFSLLSVAASVIEQLRRENDVLKKENRRFREIVEHAGEFVCFSDTLVICDHTFEPIETILVLLESPKILVSEK